MSTRQLLGEMGQELLTSLERGGILWSGSDLDGRQWIYQGYLLRRFRQMHFRIR